MQGFIKLHKQLKHWEWYKDANTMRVFIHCLINANFKDSNVIGTNVLRGQLLAGRELLAEELGLSISNVRTSLKKLQSTGEISITSNRRGTIITINNYDSYQVEDTPKVKTITPKKDIEDRIYEFKKSLMPNLDKYGQTMLKNFSDYWTEKSPKGNKMRFEKEKVFDVSRRLATWSRNNFTNANQPTKSDDTLLNNIKNKLKK